MTRCDWRNSTGYKKGLRCSNTAKHSQGDKNYCTVHYGMSHAHPCTKGGLDRPSESARPSHNQADNRLVKLERLYKELEDNKPPPTFNQSERNYNEGLYQGQLKAMELVCLEVFGLHGEELHARVNDLAGTNGTTITVVSNPQEIKPGITYTPPTPNREVS